ncbi:MAG: alpha/beta hydrolase [Actinomycetota bacterium]
MGLELPELSTVDLDGPVRYRAWDGPAEATFVLLHGLGGSNLNWVLAAPGLARLGRVLIPDLLGFGETPRAGRGSGLMDQRRLVSAFLRELGSGRVVVGGNSMGGALATLTAAVDPEAVDGLVLTNSVFPWARGGWPHPAVLAAFAAYRSPMAGEWLVRRRFGPVDPDLAVRASLAMITADAGSVPQEMTRLMAAQVRARTRDPDAGPAFLEAARSMLRLGRSPSTAARAMDAVRCPVLVLHGGRDRLVPVAFAEAALRSHPAWRGRIFPDLGHVPQIEAPDRWVAEVADWFGEV